MTTPDNYSAHRFFSFVLLSLILLLLIAPQSWARTSEIIDRFGDGTTRLDDPIAMAVDSQGNVFVVGYGDDVFRITPDGNISVVMTSAGDGTHALSYVWDMEVDSQDNLYVAGLNSSNVFKRTPDGTVTQVIDASGDGLNPLSSVYSIAVDAADNLYVGGGSSSNVFRVSPIGAITQISDGGAVGTCEASVIWDLAIAPDGTVYAARLIKDCAFAIAPDGTRSVIIDARGDGTNDLDGPGEIALDSAGNIYVAGTYSYNLFEIAANGTIRQVMDYTGNGTHMLQYPDSMVIDADDTIYLGSRSSDVVFEITPDEQIRTLIGPSGNGAATLGQPIAIDLSGNDVYVAGRESRNVFRIGVGCEPPQAIDYRGYTAASCSGTTTVHDHSQLDAYLADFGAGNGQPTDLIVAFDPTGRVNITSPCRVDFQVPSRVFDIRARNLCVYGRAGVRLGVGGQLPGSRIELQGDLYLVSEEGPSKSEKFIDLSADNMRLDAYTEARIGKQSTTVLDGGLTVLSDAGSVEIAKDIEVRAETITMSAANRVYVRDRSELHGAGSVELESRSATAAWGVFLRYDTTVESTHGTVEVLGPVVSTAPGTTVIAARQAALGSLGLGASNTVDIVDTAVQSGEVILYSDGLLRAQNSILDAGILQLQGGSCNLSGNAVSAAAIFGSCAP